MSRRHIKVELESRSDALIRGFGSRDLLVEARGGRAPVWSTVRKAWSCSTTTAMDVVALAESRNYDVSITGVTTLVEWTDPGAKSADVDHPDIEVAEVRLW